MTSNIQKNSHVTRDRNNYIIHRSPICKEQQNTKSSLPNSEKLSKTCCLKMEKQNDTITPNDTTPNDTSPTVEADNIYPALVECFGIIALGYMAGR